MAEVLVRDLLKRVTLRGTLAYAARCARRVQPIYLSRTMDQSTIQIANMAVNLAEMVASGQDSLGMWHSTDDLYEKLKYLSESDQTDPAARHAAMAASWAGLAATETLTWTTIQATAEARAEEAAQRTADSFRSRHGEAASDDPDVAVEAELAGEQAAASAYMDAIAALPKDESIPDRIARCGAEVSGHAFLAIEFESQEASESLDAFNKASGGDLNQILAFQNHMFPAVGAPIDPSENGPLGPLWPQGKPNWAQFPLESRPGPPPPPVTQGDDNPGLIIAWDPEVLGPDDYARLVNLLGDLVRAEGGVGIERIRSRGFGVPVEAGVPA